MLENIRYQVEMCENFDGFMLYHSSASGTGSGLTSHLAERLSVEYGKTSKFAYTVWPSPKMSTSVIEDYEAVWSIPLLMEHTNIAVIVDNE